MTNHDGSDAEQEARAQRDRDARGNLAAMCCTRWGVDPGSDRADGLAVKAAAREFATLADMLGLNGSPRRTVCLRESCGQPIPAWRRMDPGKAARHGGLDYCSNRCRNINQLRRGQR